MSRTFFLYAGTPKEFAEEVYSLAPMLHGCGTDANSRIEGETERTSVILFAYADARSVVPRGTCILSASPHPDGARVRVEPLAGDWEAVMPCWGDLYDMLTAMGRTIAEVMTLEELEEYILSKYERESDAWWRALAKWYWEGGREQVKSQESLAEALAASVDTVQRRFRTYRPSAEN